jgi:hypothetical protein
MAASRGRDLAWIAAPFAIYLYLLQRLWFDAPISDDYEIVLNGIMRMMDAPSAREWLAIVVAQHNEHRVAVMKMAARAVAALAGHVDFRALVLIGNLTVAGICVLAWAEFREAVAAPLFAAAAFLMFQWSYYEASLMPSAALANIGVVFFSFACLHFATRGAWPGAAACVVFGILAVGSQANGLFALPMAAAACSFTGSRRRRAWLFAAVALALWIPYFWQYSRPPHHPSPMMAVADPLATAQFFLIVIGGIVPGHWLSIGTGVGILAVLAWLTRKGVWKAHPTAALWVAFLLLSAAAATAGRVGLGVPQSQSSRYAIYSTCLVVVAFLAVCAQTRPWSGRRVGFAVLASAIASLAISWMSWPNVKAFSLAGRLLFKAVPATPDASAERYLWTLNPDPAGSRRILLAAEKRGLYSPREETLHSTALRSVPIIPESARVAGVVDDVGVSGSRVTVNGWSDIPANVPGRVISVSPDDGKPSFAHFEVTGRPDIAMLQRDARLVSSGFRIDLDFPSEALAREAAELLCISVEAPSHSPAVLARTSGRCPPAATRPPRPGRG